MGEYGIGAVTAFAFMVLLLYVLPAMMSYQPSDNDTQQCVYHGNITVIDKHMGWHDSFLDHREAYVVAYKKTGFDSDFVDVHKFDDPNYVWSSDNDKQLYYSVEAGCSYHVEYKYDSTTNVNEWRPVVLNKI